MTDTQARERRRFFRIDDAVALAVTPLSRDERDARLKTLQDTPQGSLVGELHVEREGLLPVMRELETSQPAVARYLRLLERQVDLLARAIGDPGDTLPDAPTHDVNLSAQGIRFPHGEALEPGTSVELSLKLFPSRLRLVLLGEVVACQATNTNAFDVAVDFRDITPADQELLIKHIHARQLGTLGAEESQEGA